MITLNQISAIWDEVLAVSEAPDTSLFYAALTGKRGPSYRERLHRVRKNWYGEAIPRIRWVQFHMVRASKLSPKRLPR